MTLQLHHPTDPRYLIYPVAPDEIDNNDLFDGKYGKMLVVCIGEPDAVYHKNDKDVWVKETSQ